MKRTSLAFIFTFFLSFLATSIQAAPVEFNDVKRSNTHYMSITTLAGEEIINGYPNDEFRPFNKITRGQTATLFVRALKLDTPTDLEKSLKHFKDIDVNHYYADVVAATYERGIFKGNKNREFLPTQSLTREQMATVLVNTFDLEDNGTNPTINNKGIDPSHQPNVKILVQHGITNQADNFRPHDPVTREQFATFLYRTMQVTGDIAKDMDVHFIDVGQGDSTLIQTAEGANILIDAGTQSAGQKVVQFLKEKDVGKLDMVVATHPHADHIGGLIPVLEAFDVDLFVDSGKVHSSATYENLLELILAKDIPYEIPTVGKTYKFAGDFSLTVLHADSDASNVNNASIVMKGAYDDVSFMLTGDAERSVEEKLVASSFDLKSTIYKAGHHGSNTSNTAAFVQKVKPEATIFSYGKNNSYGHPHSEVFHRLKNLGSYMYSTEENGNITVTTNGMVYVVSGKAMKDVPDSTPKPEPKPQPDPEPGVTFPININKATAEQLMELPGIGETLAPRIVAYREANGPFQSKAEIMNVKGIGEGTYNKIKDLIVVK